MLELIPSPAQASIKFWDPNNSCNDIYHNHSLLLYSFCSLQKFLYMGNFASACKPIVQGNKIQYIPVLPALVMPSHFLEVLQVHAERNYSGLL